MTEFGMGELLRRDIEEEVVLLPRLRMDMGVQDLGGVIGNGRRWFLMAWSRRGSFNLLGLWGKILGVGAFRYLVGSLGMERESGTVCEQWVSRCGELIYWNGTQSGHQGNFNLISCNLCTQCD